MNNSSIYDIKVIGIGGYARSGKDTFVTIAKQILKRNGYFVVRLAFATKLKEEVQNMLRDNGFLTSVYEGAAAKEVIRPLLVWWGCQRRAETYRGMYWVNKVNTQIMEIAKNLLERPESEAEKIVFLISDVRFENEAEWIQKTWKGHVIHLRRYRGSLDTSNSWDSGQIFTKAYDSAPNDEENENDPIVQERANFHVEWEDKQHLTIEDAIHDPELQQEVMDCLKKINLFKLSR